MASILLLLKRVSRIDKKNIQFLFITLFLCFIFCLNINGHTLYKIIFHIPGFSSMRSIDRFINLEVLLFVLVFVFSFKVVLKVYPKFRYFVYLLPVLVVLENQADPTKVKRFDKKVSQLHIDAFKDNIKKQYDPKFDAIAYMAFQTYVSPEESAYMNTVATALDVMIACQELNMKCVNSYTGFDPGNYLNFFYEPRDKTLEEWCQFTQSDCNLIQRLNDFGVKEVSRKKINLIAYNGKFIAAIETGDPVLEANRDNASSWEKFIIIEFINGDCMIKANTNLLLHVNSNFDSSVMANRKTGAIEETFRLIKSADSTVSFLSSNGKYLSVDTNDLKIYARSPIIDDTEKFRIVELWFKSAYLSAYLHWRKICSFGGISQERISLKYPSRREV